MLYENAAPGSPLAAHRDGWLSAIAGLPASSCEQTDGSGRLHFSNGFALAMRIYPDRACIPAAILAEAEEFVADLRKRCAERVGMRADDLLAALSEPAALEVAE